MSQNHKIMQATDSTMMRLSIPLSLKISGITGALLGLLTTLLAVWAYTNVRTDFSIFTTYISELGSTEGATQLIYNSGSLVLAPIRFLVGILLAWRMYQLGAGKTFFRAFITLSLVATIGIILMAAAPYRDLPEVHNAGIPLFFFGTVVLQSLLLYQEWRIRRIPRVLPITTLLSIVLYTAFAVLVTMYQNGQLDHDTPVIWEWACFLIQITWVLLHSILLGDEAGRYLKSERTGDL